MALGRAGNCDAELLAKLLADELHQLRCVMQVTAGTGPAEGQVATQSQHMVDAVIQVGLQLLLDAFLGVADAGEVGHAGALAVSDDLVQHFQVLAYIGTTGAVGAGDVIGVQGVELFQHAALTAELFHTHVRLGGEYFKGKCAALFHDLRYIHSFSLCLQIFLFVIWA